MFYKVAGFEKCIRTQLLRVTQTFWGGKVLLRNEHTLILGGARSGKSRFGEQMALKLSPSPAYIATARAGDAEMKKRIAAHKSSRSDQFTTIEEPLNLAEAINGAALKHEAILVDCLTLWLSNLMFAEVGAVERGVEELLAVLEKTSAAKVILISNEVGQGIVPDNKLAREFRDQAGLMHQRVASVCKKVVFITAGLPMVLKGSLSS